MSYSPAILSDSESDLSLDLDEIYDVYYTPREIEFEADYDLRWVGQTVLDFIREINCENILCQSINDAHISPESPPIFSYCCYDDGSIG
jgi:hypothetical protein